VRPAEWENVISNADILTLVDFWAPWCPWCRKLTPELEALAANFQGRINFVKLNTDEAPLIAAKYGVQGLPTIKFFCSGRPVGELVGYMPRIMLKGELEKYVGKYKDCLSQSSPLPSKS
jgi:thioredoxin